MKRIVVLGAAGMLGHKLCELLSREFTVYGTVRQRRDQYAGLAHVFQNLTLIDGVDVLRTEALHATLQDIRPDWVINCIGIIKQKPEAHDRYLSIRLNSLLPHELCRWCSRNGCRLVHFSTDCVFSGNKGAYSEDDESDAGDLYGKSKYLGETDDTEVSAVTIRSSIIGPEISEPKYGLLEWFLSNRNGRVKGYTKALYSGLTTLEMANVVRLVINGSDELHGTFHVAGNVIDKYALLVLINRVYGLNITIDEDPSVCVDRSLVMTRFSELTGYEAPAWEQMIEDMYHNSITYKHQS